MSNIDSNMADKTDEQQQQDAASAAAAIDHRALMEAVRMNWQSTQSSSLAREPNADASAAAGLGDLSASGAGEDTNKSCNIAAKR